MGLSKNLEKRANQLANLKPFDPKTMPKPAGRPAVAKDFRERCREFMEKESGGWDTLEEMATEKAGSFRARAVELISAYAYGKPAQKLEHAGDENNPIVLRVVYGDKT